MPPASDIGDPRVERIDPATPAAMHLLALSDAYLTSLYPPDSAYLESVSALQQPHVAFFGGYCGTQLVACGAVKALDDDGRYAEIKRVFVDDAFRGRGWSKAIMARLERHAAALGIGTIRLETGIHQPEALGLYARLGYAVRGPFGAYPADPLSVFMEKTLAPGVRSAA